MFTESKFITKRLHARVNHLQTHDYFILIRRQICTFRYNKLVVRDADSKNSQDFNIISKNMQI